MLALAVIVILLVIGAAFFAGTALAPEPNDDPEPGDILTAAAMPQATISFPGGGRIVLDNIWFGDNGPNAVVRVEGEGEDLDESASAWTFVAADGTSLVPRDSDHGNGNTLLWLDRPLPGSTPVRAIRYQSGDIVAEFRIE